MPKFNNNPWGTSSPATPYTPTSKGSSGITTTNPWLSTPATPSSPTTPSGGTGFVQRGGINNQLITRDIEVGSNSPTNSPTPWFPNPAWTTNPLITRSPEGGSGMGSPYNPDESSLITQRGGATPLLQHLNLGLSGMRAAAARGSGVRSPFKQGGGAGGAATDLEKFDNQLLAMGSEYLGKNVAGFDQGGKYNMYNNGGGFYNKAQQMKAAIMDQAMQSGIVAAQLDNVRNTNNNNATARDLVGRMRNFARGGRF